MSTRQHHIFSNQGTPAVIEPASSSNNAQKRVVCIRYTTKMCSRLFYLSKLLALSLTVLLLLSVLMIGAEVETGALHAYFIPMISMSVLATTMYSRHWTLPGRSKTIPSWFIIAHVVTIFYKSMVNTGISR